MEQPTQRDLAINSLTALLAGLTGRVAEPDHVGVVVDAIAAMAFGQVRDHFKEQQTAAEGRKK